MFVVIDSNIFIRNYDVLDSPTFERFAKHFPEKLISVFISKVSILEVFKNHKAHLSESIQHFDKLTRQINRQIVNKIKPTPISDIQQEIINYQNYFLNKIEKADIGILPIPQVEHEEIIKYANSGKRPFDSKDNGYKDFLIWMSVVGLATRSKRPIVLISNDNDFASDGTIHEQLIDHLKELEIENLDIQLVKSLGQFNETYLTDVYDLVEVKEFFKSPSELRSYGEYVSREIDQLLYNENLQNHDLNLDSRFDSPYVEYIYFRDNFKINSIDKMGSNDFAISFEISAGIDIRVGIAKSDILSLGDMINEWGEDLGEWYIEAYISREVDIEGTFTVSKDVHNIIKSELNLTLSR